MIWKSIACILVLLTLLVSGCTVLEPGRRNERYNAAPDRDWGGGHSHH